MPDIVLIGLNARYIHTAFGLKCLYANLGELRERSVVLEFEIQKRAVDIVEVILASNPKIVGIGVYIWNVLLANEIASLLKALRPELKVIVGGPEVSHESRNLPICEVCDCVIAGEGDVAFRLVCQELLSESGIPPKWIQAPLPDLLALELPYRFYTEEDLKHRLVYVEASRGCPFSCEFCLSSLDVAVRCFEPKAFLEAMEDLLGRGARHLKFVDRTFNLDINASAKILEYFLQRLRPGLLLHFEMVPDRLPDPLKDLIKRFPAGMLQLEVGIQTFSQEVAARIHRRQDFAKTAANLRFLSEETSVHVHADLIVGLPGETLQEIASGFDRLLSLGPQEIQVGILKRLRGTPILRHAGPFEMIYSPYPPYEILSTSTVPFEWMQRLRRFARYWDLVYNSGRFAATAPLIWRSLPSAFQGFLSFGDWVYARLHRTHQIAQLEWMELLFCFLTEVRGVKAEEVVARLWDDGCRLGRTEHPPSLDPHWPKTVKPSTTVRERRFQTRQDRHQSIHVGELTTGMGAAKITL